MGKCAWDLRIRWVKGADIVLFECTRVGRHPSRVAVPLVVQPFAAADIFGSASRVFDGCGIVLVVTNDVATL